MKRFETFSNLDRALKFCFKITTKSPLLIRGAEKKLVVSDNDMEFVRDSQSTIFIPGSSLKGFFRANSEKILRSINKYSCDIINSPCSKAKDKDKDKDNDKNKGNFNPNSILYCDVCELFGNQDLSSKIFFEDAYIHNENNNEPIFDRRVGIAINRKTQSVRHGPFTFETLVSDSKFIVTGIVRKFTISDLAVLNLVIKATNLGLLRIGAFKSKGYGLIEFKPSNDNQNKNHHNLIHIFGKKENEFIKSSGIKYDINEKTLTIPLKSANNGEIHEKKSITFTENLKWEEKLEGIFSLELTPKQMNTFLEECYKLYLEHS